MDYAERLSILYNVAKAMEASATSNGESISVSATGDITLYPKGGRKRNIGRIYTKKDGSFVYEKMVKSKNIFRKADAWGFNWNVINALPDDASIHLLVDRKSVKRIPVSDAREHGFFLWFKGEGHERQFMIEDRLFTIVV
jgi:hypothetical protein